MPDSLTDTQSDDGENSFRAELGRIRQNIDAVDAELLTLLCRRATFAKEVGDIKSEFARRGAFYRPEREADVIRRIHSLNPGPLDNASLTQIYREIMSACLGLETTIRVGFLGPMGSFSSSAARNHFGHAADYCSAASIDEVFKDVENRRVDYAVVPVENSTGGAVGRSLDLLLTTSATICGEILLRIHQNLLTLETNLNDIRKVYSHAQSLSQCHEWLNHHLPHAERVPVDSNSLAAEMANVERHVAAIAGVSAAEQYQLPVFAANIEDDPNNTTRFVILGEHPPGPSQSDKTSLVMSAPNQPGALHRLLTPLAEASLSMSRLESRPARQLPWQYVYYVDVEGHIEQAVVKQALRAIEERASFFKWLGSYPTALSYDG